MNLDVFQNQVNQLQNVVLSGFENSLYVDNYEGVFKSHYDWHSSVHAHWMLLSSSRLFNKPDITKLILNRFSEYNLDNEQRYLSQNPNFELPYGQAWLLLLFSELNKHQVPTSNLKSF